MSKVLVRAGTVVDAISLAPRLRANDARELTLSNGPDLEDTLQNAVAVSCECFAAEEDGKVIALWGMAQPVPDTGVPWFVGSDETAKHPRKVIQFGKEMVKRWESRCSLMMNYTHVENTVHHRWLAHIGFSFMPGTVPVGASSSPFLHFYRYSNV